MMLGLLVLFAASHGPAAHAQEADVVEVPLTKAFVPPQGFDDNDNVQAVMTGYLPNACYRLTQAVVERDGAGLPVRLRQMAERKHDGICAQLDMLPPHLSEVVPFTTEVSLGDAALGRLPAGAYSLTYSQQSRGAEAHDAQRLFLVEPALHPSVDSMQYAAVNTASVPSVSVSGESLMATIAATLTSSCSELADDVIVRRVGDVVVTLPTIRVRDNFLCAFVLRDVVRNVPIGAFNEGVFLLHVRSKNGQAVNRVFTVEARSGRT